MIFASQSEKAPFSDTRSYQSVVRCWLSVCWLVRPSVGWSVCWLVHRSVMLLSKFIQGSLTARSCSSSSTWLGYLRKMPCP